MYEFFSVTLFGLFLYSLNVNLRWACIYIT